MKTMLATVVDANGVVLCEHIAIRTHMPVRPADPHWSGSFRLEPEPTRLPEPGERLWFRIPTGEELPAVVAGCFLGDVYFTGRQEALENPLRETASSPARKPEQSNLELRLPDH